MSQSDDFENAPVARLVERYAVAAAAHGRASEQGDHTLANPEHDEVAALYRELRRRGEQRALLPLLRAENSSVRGWAAAHALEFSPSAGEQVLEELSQEAGLVGFDAQMTLETWRNGELSFP